MRSHPRVGRVAKWAFYAAWTTTALAWAFSAFGAGVYIRVSGHCPYRFGCGTLIYVTEQNPLPRSAYWASQGLSDDGRKIGWDTSFGPRGPSLIDAMGLTSVPEVERLNRNILFSLPL